MSYEYLSKEFTKILEEYEDSPLKFTMASAWLAAYFKGINLKVLHVGKKDALCDYFLLVSVQNPNQGKALAETLMRLLKDSGELPFSREGLQSSEWILLDYSGYIIHIFQEVSRGLFDLDQLWGEAPRIEIPEHFYHGPKQETDSKDEHYL